MRRIVLVLVLASFPAHAAEVILLTTGFTLRAERVEEMGASWRLHTATGTVDVPAAQIAAREVIAEPPPPPPAPVAVAPPVVVEKPKDLLADAARKLGLPPEFVKSVARIESAFRPDAVSPKGAIGMMQLMPGTAKDLGVDPHNPEQNIEGGTRLLRDLLVKYQNEPDQVRRALAAYNAGPGAVARYNGTPPYAETQNYVNKVLGEYQRLRTAAK